MDAISRVWARLGERGQTAVAGAFLGSVFTLGCCLAVLTTWTWWGMYMAIMAFFHFTEYIMTALYNGHTLSVDSFLLNHSTEYGLAAVFGWAEYMLECWLFPGVKIGFISAIGLAMAVVGQFFRTAAMYTAGSNFTHMVASKKKPNHALITHGVYSISRHPSYMGWFWWSVGTQLLLCNPLSTIGYAVASWKFFESRIPYEEAKLHEFFGEAYGQYCNKVATGIPYL